jgi:peptidyl-tRNA hydrolase, PTH1 family
VSRVVVGLGNPGSKYAETRHNVGFMLIERLARALEIQGDEVRDGARRRTGCRRGEPFILVEPLQFMNRSGPPLRTVLDEFGAGVPSCLVVHDELDLRLGRIKLKRGGGTGGHRGLQSIVAALEGADFARLRLGIGRPAPGQDAVDHVLAPFEATERPLLESVLGRAEEAVWLWAEVGVETAMNRINAAPGELEGSPEGC